MSKSIPTTGTGKGDYPRKFNKEPHKSYLNNDSLWDSMERKKQQLEHENKSKAKT